ncbi:MAG: DUF1553 domain-containing protein [Planctomycetaceae bacterium]|nr:DUF1553 domain-containing protein [Planctomycetaceae bacterium]
MPPPSHTTPCPAMMIRSILALCVIGLCFSSPAIGEETPKLSYARDVRPILSTNCFQCHGPDDKTREADLRLDEPESAFSSEDRSAAIIPGKPGESELVARITSEDEFLQMPPADSKKSITPEQIEILKQWIAQGAEYEKHWAFIPPQRPQVPLADQVNNPIDGFIRAKLKEVGLEPNPPADRYTLVRRVYLDLIGLPPTPEQADAFVNDPSSNAYENLVEELLASPHYGERWARRWLDLARYSDTNGYEKDRPRSMYLYRDWVINALNSGMPFDQFTIEQIAGDMLPEATESQKIATGFHRNTMVNEEGGVDPLEFRFYAMVDRVNTTGTTWLGLTIGCAQCHTHKYDPITQTEYYSVMAFLNNADEPRMKVRDPHVVAQRARIQKQIDAFRDSLADKFPLPPENERPPYLTPRELRARHRYAKFHEWLNEQEAQYVEWEAVAPVKVTTNLPNITILEDKSVLVSGDQTKNDIFTVNLTTDRARLTAIRLEALPHESLPYGGPGRATIHAGVEKGGEFFLSEIKFEMKQGKEADWEPVNIASVNASFSRDNRLAEHSIDGKTDTGWSVNPRIAERHQAVYQFEKPIENKSGEIQFRIRMEHESFHPAGLGRFRFSVTDQAGELKAFDRPLEIERILKKPKKLRTSEEKQALMQRFLEVTPLLKKEQDHLANLKKQLPEYPTTLVMQERPERFPRTTHRHHRGEFLSPREDLEPAVPDVLHDIPKEALNNRLTFAKWLVDRENPLTARVIMNRHWEAFFGRGIVRTTEDFGLQGELPSHPKLLDWLAVEFMDRGWRLKEMHKLIVLSETYRQSAAISERAADIDPMNVYLSHAPRVRLEAELVRDQVLAAAGLLSQKIGGPSVFPPQPPGITEAAYGRLNWVVSQGEDRYRRGLYTFNKRTAPYAMFSTFDAPSGEACISRRDPSNTPLQALTMLNSEVLIESAQHLALRTLHEYPGDPDQQIRALFRDTLVRPPSEQELTLLHRFYDSQRNELSHHEQDAHLLVGAGILKRWDFENGTEGWTAANQSTVKQEQNRLVVESTGNDPFLRTSLETGVGQVTVSLRLHSEHEGKGQLFWTSEKSPAESAQHSASFDVKPGWGNYEVTLQADSPLTGLRFDPVAKPGKTEIDWIELSVGSKKQPVPEGVDVVKWASLTLVARSLMNLDEAITKP